MHLLSQGLVGEGDVITGQFYVGSKRVYGRFTQLKQKRSGNVFPVCLEFWTQSYVMDDEVYLDGAPGLPRQKGGDEDTAVVFNRVTIRAVLRYEEG